MAFSFWEQEVSFTSAFITVATATADIACTSFAAARWDRCFRYLVEVVVGILVVKLTSSLSFYQYFFSFFT
jgi:hypothetical protein